VRAVTGLQRRTGDAQAGNKAQPGAWSLVFLFTPPQATRA
jgi:hypothetical protein